MGADHKLLVRDKFSLPVHCLVVRWLIEQRTTAPQNGLYPLQGNLMVAIRDLREVFVFIEDVFIEC